MNILIDRNIERFSVTHITTMKSQTIRWGRHWWGGWRTFTTNVAQRTYRPPRQDAAFLQEQLPYLASVCNAAKGGALAIYSSFELLMERHRQKGSPQGYLGINLLEGVPMRKVPCPVSRPLILGGHEPFNAEEEERKQMDFFRSIQHPRFVLLKATLGDAQMDDAFHLWTAEEASLDAFLTLDKKFRNNFENRKKELQSRTAVMFPKEVCDQMGLGPTDIEQLAAKINPFR